VHESVEKSKGETVMEAGLFRLIQIAASVGLCAFAVWGICHMSVELWRVIKAEWRWCDDVGDRQVESSTFVEDNERGGE
jgi:hypothetical protein